MTPFLEKIFSWRPFARRTKRPKRTWRDERITSATDLARGGKRPPVPRRDLLIGLFAGANLVLLPWFVAGQPIWAQWTSLALSALAFAFLFLPIGFDGWRSASADRSLDALLRCPPFWCGLALMGLLALQGANPRLEVEFDGALWQLLPMDPVEWLPSGVRAPIQTNREPGGMNAFREMLIFGSPWLMFCALWCGVRSRRVIQWLVIGTLASCTALAVFSMGMRSAGDLFLYNSISVSVGSVYGTFLYQNQGGAFFYLAALLAASLALSDRLAHRGDVLRGGRHFVFFAATALLAAASVYSASFAALGGTLAGALALLPAWWFARPASEGDEGSRRWIGAGIAGAMIAALVAAAAFSADLQPVWQKIMHKFNLINEAKVDDRAGMRTATWTMFRENSLLFGSGGGSYRWISPEYFARLPEFRDAAGRLAQRANYAHFDWLQMLAEWGVFGVSAVLAAGAWALNRLRRSRIWAKPAVWPLALAPVILAAHACLDYLLFNPAVALLFTFTVFVSLAWAREGE